MVNLLPFRLESTYLITEPLSHKIDYASSDRFVEEVFEIFNDYHVIKEHPEKKHNSLEATKEWIGKAVLGNLIGTSQTSFTRLKENNRVIGIVEVVLFEAFPKGKQKFYKKEWPNFKGCCEIEYWLNSDFWRQKVMSNVVEYLTNGLLQQGIPGVTAMTYISNLASLKVLKNAGFTQLGLLPQTNGGVFSHQMKSKETV